jgi:type II secretion system protein G
MLARLRKSAEHKDSGFTLIELLVVMIIIGILAAIAIPAFLSQRAKAQDSAAKADVSTIGKEIATFYVDGTGPAVSGRAAAYITTPATGTVEPRRASENDR